MVDVAHIEMYYLTSRQIFMKELWRDLYKVSLKTGRFSSREHSVLFSSYAFAAVYRTVFGIISDLFTPFFRTKLETVANGKGELWFSELDHEHEFDDLKFLEIRIGTLERKAEHADS